MKKSVGLGDSNTFYTFPVYTAIRHKGQIAGESWVDKGWVNEISDFALSKVKSSPDAQRAVAEVCFSHSFSTVDLNDKKQRYKHFSNIQIGIHGIEITFRKNTYLISPTTMIAKNCSFDDAFDNFRKKIGIGINTFYSDEVVIRSFRTTQFFIDSRCSAVKIFRGNQLVSEKMITKHNIERLQKALGDYLIRNVQADGRMVYIYKPSLGGENKKQNNMIRQWMASLALVRAARNRNDDSLYALAEKNIRYNLNEFYREDDGYGYIFFRKKAKLGAIALAFLAINELPVKDSFKRYTDGLSSTIEYLWQEDGSFRTFYMPSERNDVQNFYPGEALLAWAALYKQTRSEALLDRFMKSFRYYQRWHLKNRNPAFIPWHTQAAFILWKETRCAELSSAIFAMNDWLLSMQQWDDVSCDDIKGRFYDPGQKNFGPPHASATGVYLEGLIDAFELARELGFKERAEKYRTTILRGVRSVMQLTFKNEIDMFYSTEPERLIGGVRTTVYNNEVRVDNVQHNLLAIDKVLKIFTPKDYEL